MIQKIVLAKVPQSRKWGKRKSLVIVAGENLTEIRHRWRLREIVVFAKIRIVGSDDSENTFGKVP